MARTDRRVVRAQRCPRITLCVDYARGSSVLATFSRWFSPPPTSRLIIHEDAEAQRDAGLCPGCTASPQPARPPRCPGRGAPAMMTECVSQGRECASAIGRTPQVTWQGCQTQTPDYGHFRAPWSQVKVQEGLNPTNRA